MPNRSHYSTEEEFLLAMRDWFAGQALVGLCANHDTGTKEESIVANWCYKQADEMMIERARE